MKRNRKLIWQLYPSFLIVVIISLVAITGYTTRSVREYFLDQNKKNLITQGMLLKRQLIPYLSPLDVQAIEKLCNDSVRNTGTRLTFILPDGKVIGDSNEIPALMDNHLNRPEVREALEGRIGSSIRFSATVNRNMMYVAAPVMVDNKIAAVLRTSVAVTSIDEEVSGIQVNIAIAGIMTAILASVICWWLARRISRPMERMKQGAERFARGDLKYRLSMPDTLEMAGLAESMNQMAEQLESRMVTIIDQRNEYEAVLSSMVEGVMAVDLEERVLSINRAAAAMLNVGSPELKRVSVQEIVRNLQLNRFISQTLTTGQVVEGDININGSTPRILNLICSPLHNADQERIGALAVLHDVTRLRNLETVRQDFVANVSHELKTPLTAIKGFVETLLSSSGPPEPEDSERFLQIINKHVDRLNMIIEDLLSLADIEQLDQYRDDHFQSQSFKPVIESAIEVLKTKADDKEIVFSIETDDRLKPCFDAGLMEQALVNLLDNAINYGPEKSTIEIQTGLEKSEYFISIKDQGPGIQQKHLPRLFERFYRADKARSRAMGGTGLGLAIVKHIVQHHAGRITVDTSTGNGSTFTVYIPKER